MSGKNIIFNDKKFKKRDFHRNKKPFKIDDIDFNKVLVSKEEPYRINDPILLDIVTTMLLDFYAQCVLKLLFMLNFSIILKQCLLRSVIKSF